MKRGGVHTGGTDFVVFRFTAFANEAWYTADNSFQTRGFGFKAQGAIVADLHFHGRETCYSQRRFAVKRPLDFPIFQCSGRSFAKPGKTEEQFLLIIAFALVASAYVKKVAFMRKAKISVIT